MTLLVRQLPPEADRVLISVNLRAGSRSGWQMAKRLSDMLNGVGYSATILSDPDRLEKEAAAAHRQGVLRAVVAAGGDGTVAMVANRTEPGVPVAILPLGTENLLSKYLDIPPDAAAVFQAIRDGWTVPLDAGRAGDRIFLLMASCGLDADVVRRLHAERSGHIHHLSYVWPIFEAIRNYEFPELRIYCHEENGGQERVIAARWMFAFNLPAYARGLNIAPDAEGTDGLLDVCTFREGSLWHSVLYIGGVLLGQHREWEGVVNVRTRQLRIESDTDVPYQLDGDPGGRIPVEIDILPGRVTTIVPRAWAMRRRYTLGATAGS